MKAITLSNYDMSTLMDALSDALDDQGNRASDALCQDEAATAEERCTEYSRIIALVSEQLAAQECAA